MIVRYAAESRRKRNVIGAAVFVGAILLGTQIRLHGRGESNTPSFARVSTAEVRGSGGECGKVGYRHTPAAQKPKGPRQGGHSTGRSQM